MFPPRKWAAGILLCLGCDQKHVGSWPIGAEPLRCPHCLEYLAVPHNGAGFGDIPFSQKAGDENAD
jgi:hypothetical protein